MDLHLGGKVALVTGASSGIGLAAARRLAAEGARLMLVSRTGERLEALASDLRQTAGVEADVHAADLTRPTAADEAVAATLARYGRLDVVVTSAGASGAGVFWEIPDSVWQASFELKFMASLRTIRAALAPMRAQGSGRIVVLAGNLGRAPLPRGLPSAFANAALLAIVKGVADEVAAEGIRINAVSPGLTRTPRFEERIEREMRASGRSAAEIEADLVRSIPSGRVSEPDEVARTIAWLASDAAGQITGTNITIDGGHTRAVT